MQIFKYYKRCFFIYLQHILLGIFPLFLSYFALFFASALCSTSLALAADSASSGAQDVKDSQLADSNISPEPEPESDNEIDPTAAVSQAIEGSGSGYAAAGPEGKTLPQGVMRIKLPLRFSRGNRGYDSEGKKVDAGANAVATGAAFVVEYGISDDLSFQLLVPYVVQNDLGINADKFQNSATYKVQYQRFVTSAAAALEKNGLCVSQLACLTLISQGYSLPYNTNLVLPTGETITVQARQPIKDVARNLILEAIRPTKGATGLGDLELGLLYSALNERGPFSNSPVFVSLGAGFRLPTGKFADVSNAQRPTGRGTFDLGVRSNVDYNPTHGLFISWQNRVEFMLAKGKKKKSSLLQNNTLNTANPQSPAAIAAGSDGQGNEVEFSRKGARNVGFVKAAFGLGALDDSLKLFGANAQLKYDYDSVPYLADQKLSNAPNLLSAQLGVTLDGLAYSFPAQLDIDYETPLGGENVSVATENLFVTLKGYYRF